MRNKTTYWRFKPWVVVLFLALYTLSICGITAAATWAIVTSVNSSSTGTDSLSDGLDGHMELRKPIILCRSEERRVGKECRSRWSPYH